MEFTKFNSIENSYREKFIQKIKEEGLNDGEWIVQEKVHGANFSVWYDGAELKSAKRSGFNGKGENFNGSLKILTNHEERIKLLYQDLVKEHGPDLTVTVYGEIAGGSYIHSDVEKDTHATRVQKGVYYSPTNIFYAFDIKCNGKFLSVTKCNELFEKHNFFYAKTLFKGSFEECLEYKDTFQTFIPEWLGLPQIDDNICEGIVIRPIETSYLSSGSRVILKKVNEKFAERKMEKDKRTKKPAEPLPKYITETFAKISGYITENRLRHVLSHLGKIETKDFGKVMAAFNRDILEDFQKDYDDLKKMEKYDTKIISRLVNKETANMIRENFLNIIDGNF